MADRFALLYQECQNGLGLDELCSLLMPLGLKLEHPEKDHAIVLDDIGEQWPIEHVDLRARLARGDDTTFEIWYSADHDLICRSRLTNGVRVTHIDLSGTNEAERISLGQVLREAACNQILEGGWLGLIFDPDGISAEYDWDKFFLGESPLSAIEFPEGVPMIFLVSEGLVPRLQGFKIHTSRGGMARVADE